MKSSQCVRYVVVSLALGLLGIGVVRGAEPSATAPKKDTFWLIPHTHWEGAVFITREDYLQTGVSNILRALKLLKADPSYRFTLDQACYVKPFLERFPEEEAVLRKYVAEGRLAIVGGTDVMPDVNMPSGESFVRQILYGKGFFREKLGVDVTVGWQLDTFGHNAQVPQILRSAGFTSFWFFRGVPSMNTPSEILWKGLDGSQIAAFWLPQGYAITYGAPAKLPEFAEFMKGRFHTLDPQAKGPDRAGPAGADVCEPEEHVPALVEQFNRLPDAPFRLRLAVPTEFEKAVSLRSDRPVLQGELNPIFQGAYSSRIELKQYQRNLERLLTAAESLAVLNQGSGSPACSKALWRAWEPVLFNQTHDLASGVMTDRVYDDTVAGYRFSERLADEMVDAGLGGLCNEIDTQGDGAAVVVWNPLGWSRSDVAEVDLGISEPDVRDVTVLDSNGQPVPHQLVSSERYANGGLLRARIAFIAREVPAIGYSVFHIRSQRGGAAAPSAVAGKEPGVIENEHYRAAFNVGTGALTSLEVKDGRWQALAGPANVVAREHDGGDLWELYRPLDGASRIAMTTKQAVPRPGKAVFSSDFTAAPGSTTVGPVFSEFTVGKTATPPYNFAQGNSCPSGSLVGRPFDNGTFATRVRLYAGLKRIDIHTQIVNNAKFVRYQALFPTAIPGGRTVHEIPFGAIERPAAIEFPAQNWADYGDGKHGVALLNRGLPGNLTTDGTLMLSLARSTAIVAYGFGGGYGPGMSSDTGFELGKPLDFDYAMVPHAGDWRDAGIYRAGLEFNQPLLVRKVLPHAGSLPKRWGLLDVSHSNVVVSSLKPGRDGTAVLRIYEAAGTASRGVTIALHAKLLAADEANLMEDSGQKLSVTDNRVTVDLRPFEIKTLKFHIDATK